MFYHPQNAAEISTPPSVAKEEDGFVLLAVLFMLFLVVLSLSLAVPSIVTELRREKEAETIHRGMQYARAIRVYYKKYGRYPNTIDQLINTDGQRFLRRRYLDPLTGKDDWRIIHFGEAQTMSNTIPGSSPVGANGTTGSSATGFGGPASSGFGSSSGSGFGSSGSAFGSSGSSGFGSSSSAGFGSSSSSGFGSSGSSSSAGSSGISFANSGSTSSTGTGSTTGTGSGSTGTSGGSAFGSPGATLGGAPIVGVGLPLAKTSIKILKKQTHYNQWEFIYDPNQDLGGAMGQTGAGALQGSGSSNSINGTTNGMGGSSSGFGSNGSSNSGFGGNSGGSSGFGGSSGGTGGTNGSGSSPTAPAPTSPFGGSSSPF